jgi:hypothetical protein
MSLPDANLWTIRLDNEANDARSLFSHGLAVTRDMRRDYHSAAAAMSLLALGAEKLLKLTIGLAKVNDGHPWPSTNYMKRIGHKVATADRKARQLIDLQSASTTGELARMRDEVDGDKVLAAGLKALERFGNEGRFYFLDSLGEDPQDERAPHMMWVEMGNLMVTDRPDILAKISAEDEGIRLNGRAEGNALFVDSLTRWWEFYRTVWAMGVIGEPARQFTTTLRLLSDEQMTHGR